MTKPNGKMHKIKLQKPFERLSGRRPTIKIENRHLIKDITKIHMLKMIIENSVIQWNFAWRITVHKLVSKNRIVRKTQ